jgi:hypothetical protein
MYVHSADGNMIIAVIIMIIFDSHNIEYY